MYSTNKFWLSICLFVTFGLFLSSCQTVEKPLETNASSEFYNPIVFKNGNNILLEKDRQECLEFVKINKISSDRSPVVLFRKCLIDKGYLLLS